MNPMTKLHFRGEWPETAKAEIHGILRVLVDAFAPSWCREIHLWWQVGLNDGALATIQVRLDARDAILCVNPSILTENVRRVLLHEIAHLHTTPVENIARLALEAHFGQDAEGINIARVMMDQVLEGATNDLADVFETCLKPVTKPHCAVFDNA